MASTCYPVADDQPGAGSLFMLQVQKDMTDVIKGVSDLAGLPYLAAVRVVASAQPHDVMFFARTFFSL